MQVTLSLKIFPEPGQLLLMLGNFLLKADGSGAL